MVDADLNVPLEACGNLIRTARAADGSGGWFVAECGVVHIEGLASRRARLFAASPELLAAAVAAEAIFARAHWLEDGPDPEAVALRMLRAAIAKATGDARG